MAGATPYRGRPLRRFEDERLLRGEGSFVDDMHRPGMLHASVLRSPHAHARIRSVDASRARAMAGVVAVLTGDDVHGVLPNIAAVRREGMGETPIPEHPVLAHERVCYVGQPVAIAVAEDRYAARDALDLIEVSYEPLEPLLDPRAAAEPDAPLLHPGGGSNVVLRTAAGAGDVEGAFAAADHVVRASFEVPRLAAVPMECRATLAEYDASTDTLTVWTSTQVPHRVKTYLANLLPEAPSHIRVIAPDVGGGFGRKIEVWPEEVALAYLAQQLGRPVKWAEDRSENVVTGHGRGFTADVEAAVASDGRVLGMRFRMLADLGAFFLTSTGGPPGNAVQRVAGPYAIEAMDVECLGVVTNRPPTGPYRGAGGPEAAVLIERTMDLIAAELGMDPVELRRRNFIPADAFPYETATGLTYDSGDFGRALERVLELAGYDEVRERQRAAGGDGPLIGIGVATIVKASGGKANVRNGEARVEIDATGRVTIYTDVSPHGQGIETSFAQIAADLLGVPPEDVSVRHGDTDMLATGGGTTSSRGLAVGGSAAYLALEQAQERLTRAAATLLGCAPADVSLADGAATAAPQGASTGRVPIGEVAAAAHREDGELVFSASYTLPANPFAFAAHAAVVEIDRDTGDVALVRFAAVHDCGRIINPMIVRGQIHGGITQGIGQALSEAMVYDDDGQPLTGSLMTYGIPTAETTPSFILDHIESPSPTNPLGIKGIGELPTVAAPVAVANAVMDALRATATRHIDMPLLPEKVWRALREGA